MNYPLRRQGSSSDLWAGCRIESTSVGRMGDQEFEKGRPQANFARINKDVGPMWPLQAPPTAQCAKITLICIIRREEFGRTFNDAQCIARSCSLKVSPTPPSTEATQDARITGASYVKRGPGWTLVSNPGRQVATGNIRPWRPLFSDPPRI